MKSGFAKTEFFALEQSLNLYSKYSTIKIYTVNTVQ